MYLERGKALFLKLDTILMERYDHQGLHHEGWKEDLSILPKDGMNSRKQMDLEREIS
jgi:hypothetical protein